jgi:glutamate-1-semialdehyde aminotransferase/spore coat polysaccharide biosynthesis protein SpsF (cytidylyltransferase family)
MPSSNKTIAIIQARMRSSRLPGKILAQIGEKPMIWHVAQRVRVAKLVDEVVLATSSETCDDPVADFCKRENINCFRGCEIDVLDRFYQAAKINVAKVIVRLTGDCPFIDPDVIDSVIQGFHNGEYDYATNILRYTWPEGLDVEVFSFEALERAWKEATQEGEREHVTVYIRDSGHFRVAPNVECSSSQTRTHLHSWSVDTPADLDFSRAIYSRLRNQEFRVSDILTILDEEPALLAMKSATVRNEWFYRVLAKEPQVPATTRTLKTSHAILERASKLIPTLSQTFSKAPTQFVQGVAPNYITRGHGCHVWDVDNNEYLDYSMALAPVVLGHADPDVTAAVSSEIQNGTAFSLPHPLEVEVAGMLVSVIPCAEMVRFGKNGSDATAAAIRLARAYTGREVVAMCGYHGWHDWCIGTTTRNKGIPRVVCDLTKTFIYNDITSLEEIFVKNPGQVAAVILEATGVIAPQPGFLESVKEIAHRHGALLVFDEIVNGFRLAIGGAQEYFGITPDLACFGKAMGNGFPISAIVGRRDVMELIDEVFFSFTFGGETTSLAAAKAVIEKMTSQPVIDHLWEQGQRIKDGFNILADSFGVPQFARCIGYAPRTVCVFCDNTGSESLLLKSLFQQECLKRGVLFTGGHNLSLSHTAADVSHTLRVYRTAMEIIAEAIHADNVAARLEGSPVQPVFRKA